MTAIPRRRPLRHTHPGWAPLNIAGWLLLAATAAGLITGAVLLANWVAS